jgi:glutamate-1-semialdehyde 2,1-aminomutase
MLQEGFEEALKRHHVSAAINRVGSMMTVFFGVDRVRNAAEARECDREAFARFFHGMLKQGIYMPPAPFEAAFLSLAHTRADLGKTIAAFNKWLAIES